MHSLLVAEVVLLLSSVCLLGAAIEIELPAGIRQCTINDEACIKDGVQYVLSTHAKNGIKELGLVPLDPLHIKKLQMGRNPTSSVSVDLVFSEVDLLGLQNAQVKRVSGYTRDLSKPIEFDMFVPKMVLKGPYSVDGRVLILPVTGKGDAQIVLEQSHFRAKLKLRAVTKGDGQTYLEVANIHLNMEPRHVTYKMSGLFNGQKELSDNLHLLINENWLDIFNEVKADMSEAVGLIFKAVLNRTYGKIPMQYLFADL